MNENRTFATALIVGVIFAGCLIAALSGWMRVGRLEGHLIDARQVIADLRQERESIRVELVVPPPSPVLLSHEPPAEDYAKAEAERRATLDEESRIELVNRLSRAKDAAAEAEDRLREANEHLRMHHADLVTLRGRIAAMRRSLCQHQRALEGGSSPACR